MFIGYTNFKTMLNQIFSSSFYNITAGLSYVELGTMFPSSGGEYVYILEGSRPFLAFLNIYARSIVIKPAGTGIMALTCARYFLVPFYSDGCGPPSTEHIQMLAICFLCM